MTKVETYQLLHTDGFTAGDLAAMSKFFKTPEWQLIERLANGEREASKTAMATCKPEDLKELQCFYKTWEAVSVALPAQVEDRLSQAGETSQP